MSPEGQGPPGNHSAAFLCICALKEPVQEGCSQSPDGAGPHPGGERGAAPRGPAASRGHRTQTNRSYSQEGF